MTWWLFQNVVITVALAAAVAMICRCTRIGPVARHALWLVVLVKFVTPPLVVWPWVAPDPFGIATLDRAAGHRRVLESTIVTDGRTIADASSIAAVIPADPGDRPVEEWFHVTARAFAGVWPWLPGVWLAGSLALLAIEAVRLARLARAVRRGRPADAQLQARVAVLCERLRLRRVAVRVMPGSAPPAVWCLGRPQVLWPEDLAADASDVTVDALLLHELAHVKRADHFVGWIELVAGIVWWWNPLFWFVRSALREQAELACDAWVISTMPNGRRAYAESLLVLSGAAPRHVSMAVVGIRASTRHVLERRLAMIMQGQAPLRLTRVGLLSLVFAAALVLPGWAAPQDPPPPPPPAPPVRVQQPTPPPPPPAQAATTAPTRRAARQNPPPPPPPPPPAAVEWRKAQRAWNFGLDTLPADSQELLKVYEADVEAIQREVDQRIAARRDEVIKALQALQEQHTKAGRLDQAVAIRDYLQSGQPMSPTATYWRFKR